MIYSLSVAIAALVTLIMINNSEQLTESMFVTNTYLYVILAIMIAALSIAIIEITKFMPNHIILFILSIIIIFAFVFVDKKNIFVRNMLFITFAAIMGAILYPAYKLNGNSPIFANSAIAVLILVSVLTFITYQYPDNYFDNWGTILLGSLFTLIVFQLLDIFFGDPISSKRYKIYAYIGLFIFSAYIMYDTKKLYQYAKTAKLCTDMGGDNLVCADYPLMSMNLFLDILNLFSSMNLAQK